MSFNNVLVKLGFTPVEASVFATLCKHGPLTGYEVAKHCGISRSNVYSALYSLQEKGKCHTSEGESTKYVALSKEEFLLSIKREMSHTLTELETYYPSVLPHSEPYLTTRGYANVLSQIKNSILLCKSHLYIMSASEHILLFEDELLAIAPTRKVTIICEKQLNLSTHLTIYKNLRQIEGFYMIIDTKSVITGDLTATSSQCLCSSNASMVRLLRESFITALDMITLQNN